MSDVTSFYSSGMLCAFEHCLVTPVLVMYHSLLLSPRGGRGPVVMRKLRMRRFHCATSVAPCCALVSSALALYRLLQLDRQVYLFISPFSFVFFPISFFFNTYGVKDSFYERCSQIELRASLWQFYELLEVHMLCRRGDLPRTT